MISFCPIRREPLLEFVSRSSHIHRSTLRTLKPNKINSVCVTLGEMGRKNMQGLGDGGARTHCSKQSLVYMYCPCLYKQRRRACWVLALSTLWTTTDCTLPYATASVSSQTQHVEIIWRNLIILYFCFTHFDQHHKQLWIMFEAKIIVLINS